MSQYLMPSLGSDMTAGTLVEQTIAPGEVFHRGDVIAAVETQKGMIEVEVFEDGILDRWLVDLGTEVPVGTPLAALRKAGEDRTEPPEAPTEMPREPVKVPSPPPTIEPPPSEIAQDGKPDATLTGATRPKITPAGRRLAASLGIDLGALSVAPDQVLTRRDIERLAESETQVEAARPDKEAPNMRSAIAAAMSRSKREIPHYYLTHQIDLGAVTDYLTKLNATRPPTQRLLSGALFARAIALCLKKFPEFNGHYVDDKFHPSKSANIGIAIHIRSGGLVAPAIFDVDTKSADEVMADLSDLVSRVRDGRFKARELTEATITLTSLGERGVDGVIGVIYPPQVAIVGIGTPRPTPIVREGAVVSRIATTLSLAADHRVSDGHRGALFLRAMDKKLQEPETL